MTSDLPERDTDPPPWTRWPEPGPPPPPDFETALKGVRQARAVLEALANIDKHKPPEQEPTK